jgi:anti-anti-sigma factor
MSEYKCFKVAISGDVTEVHVKKEELSDLVLQNKFHEELMDLIRSQQPGKLLVSFQPVRYCATSIINSLVAARKETAAYGGRLRLCEMSVPVREAFKTLNLDGTLFEILDSLTDARAEF